MRVAFTVNDEDSKEETKAAIMRLIDESIVSGSELTIVIDELILPFMPAEAALEV